MKAKPCLLVFAMVVGVILTGNPIDAQVTVRFDAPRTFETGYGPYDVVFEDLNGDGKTDMAIPNQSDDSISVLFGNADGTFQDAADYATGDAPYALTVTDFNHDNAPDLATANYNAGTMSVFLNNGDGTFAPKADYASGAGSQSVAAGYLNSDTHPDLVTANFSDNTLSVFLGNGDGSFQAAVNISTTYSGPVSVAIDDLDGDGKQDLIAASYYNGILVFLGNGDGTFQPLAFYASGYPYSLAVTDFNGDGKPDVAAASTSVNGISILLNNGDGTLQAEVTYSGGESPRSISTGDLNNDGKADLVTGNYSGNTVSVFLGDGDGTFQSAVDYPAAYLPQAVAIEDVNGDTHPDLAVTNGLSYAVSILMGNGDGTFTSHNRYDVGDSPAGVAAGDVNGDTYADLVTANLNGDSISVLMGNGDGTFQTAADYSAGNGPFAVVITDLNADTKPDLAVANTNGDTVSVFFGNGDGTFEAAGEYPVDNGPYSVASGNLNADTYPDLVTGNFNNDVSVLINNGDGTFQTAVHYPAGDGPYAVAMVDIDEDGKTDVITANGGENKGYVLLGNGDGTLQAAAAVTVGTAGYGIAVIDLNGDGKHDLVTADYSGNSVRVLFGNGDGSFQTAAGYATGIKPQTVATADVNGDGRQDILTANKGNVDVSILLNNGDGTFRSPITYYSGGSVNAVVAADLNNDGKPDIAAPNFASDDLSILINRTPSISAGTYYVDIGSGADDPAYGTSAGAGAWKTLHYAIERINDGEAGAYVLNVSTGTYNPTTEGSSTLLTIAQDSVTIAGQGTGSTVIDGNSDATWEDGFLIQGSGTTIKNLTITDFASRGIYIESGADTTAVESCDINNCYRGIRIESSGNSVKTCAVHNNDRTGIQIYSSGGNNILSNNEIYTNVYYGINIYDSSADEIFQNSIYDHANGSGVGICLSDAEARITRNEIHDNDYGIEIDTDIHETSPAIENNLIYNTLYDAISISAYYADANPTILHNTFDGTGCCFIYIYTHVNSASPTIKYNIFSNSDYDGIVNSSYNEGTPTSDYNDFWNISGDPHVDLSPGSHDIFENPLFASYSLQEASPCIDAVPATEPDPVTEDFEGTPRPRGSGFDIGAYEMPVAQYTLTVSISPSGSGTVADDTGAITCPDGCTQAYDAGASVTLTATPEAGHQFDAWSGDISDTANPTTITLDADKTVTAVFEAVVDNAPPSTPSAVSPADGSTVASAPVTLRADAFSDPEGDSQSEARWLVRRADSVYYRSDYDPSFNQAATTGDLTVHELSGLEDGMQYVWMVGYTDSGSGQTSWSQEYRFTVGTSVLDRHVVVSEGTKTADYEMVSVVQWPDKPAATSVFGITPDTKSCRIGTYDPLNGAYIEYGSELTVAPGRAYWALVRNGMNPAVSGVPVSTALDIEIGLIYNPDTGNGWNMIACPNGAAYLWKEVEVLEYDADGNILFGPEAIGDLADSNDYIDKRLWRWNRGSYESDTDSMEPYAGYWVKVKKENVFLSFPADRQLALDSRMKRLLADLFRRTIRHIGTTASAVADDGDSPPMPMDSLGSSRAEDAASSMGCFIETVCHGK